MIDFCDDKEYILKDEFCKSEHDGKTTLRLHSVQQMND